MVSMAGSLVTWPNRQGDQWRRGARSAEIPRESGIELGPEEGVVGGLGSLAGFAIDFHDPAFLREGRGCQDVIDAPAFVCFQCGQPSPFGAAPRGELPVIEEG